MVGDVKPLADQHGGVVCEIAPGLRKRHVSVEKYLAKEPVS